MGRNSPVQARSPFANAANPEHIKLINSEKTWRAQPSLTAEQQAKRLKLLGRRVAARRIALEKSKPLMEVAKFEVAREQFITRNAFLGMNPVRFEQLRAKFVEITSSPEFKAFVHSKRQGLDGFVQAKLNERVQVSIKNPATGAIEVRSAPAVNVPFMLIAPFSSFAIHHLKHYEELRPVEKKQVKKKK